MKQILFVDDKPAIGKVLSVYLGKENELVYFEDPVRAIEWLNEGNEPALIISDIRMPKMTGSEFLAYLKSNSLFKDIPVVMLPVKKVPPSASTCSKPGPRISY